MTAGDSLSPDRLGTAVLLRFQVLSIMGDCTCVPGTTRAGPRRQTAPGIVARDGPGEKAETGLFLPLCDQLKEMGMVNL